jgi:endonuclease/exonuclease/phosphatase family metal-dependent hydrolase
MNLSHCVAPATAAAAMWRWGERYNSRSRADESTSWRIVESPPRSRKERAAKRRGSPPSAASTARASGGDDCGHIVAANASEHAVSKSVTTPVTQPVTKQVTKSRRSLHWRKRNSEPQTPTKPQPAAARGSLDGDCESDLPTSHEAGRSAAAAASNPPSPVLHPQDSNPALSRSSGELVVMTWNLMRDFKHFNSKNPAFAWESREPRIIKVIQDANPSILTLQECIDLPGQPIVKFLNKLKGLGYEFEVFCDVDGNNTKQLRVVTLWKPALYRLSSKTLWLSPDYASSRPALEWGQVVARPVGVSCFLHPYGDMPLWVFNVHMGHAEFEKSQSCYALVQMVADTCMSSGQAALAMGDFNVFTESDIYNLRGIITDNNLCPMTDLAVDARTVLGDLPAPCTFVSSSIDSQRLLPGQCGDRLDHVFGRKVTLNGAAKVWNKTMLPVEPPFLLLQDQFPSDHLPLVLRVNCLASVLVKHTTP